MVPVLSLWVPILLSAVLVFVASSILHMVLSYHRTDLRKLPHEDEILDTLRRLNVPAGDYAAPHAGSPAAMKDPAFVEKMKRGPLVLMTIAPGAAPAMGKLLLQWFLYCVVVSVFAAYIAGSARGPGARLLGVCRFAGVTAFIGYSLALAQFSIWYKRNWGTTIKSVIDGLIYGLLTALTFGLLWPS